MTEGKNAYAAILAGGLGERMGNVEKPKQYFSLAGKPILAHTVEKFCASELFAAVIVLCPQGWLAQTQDLMRKHCGQYASGLTVIPGGKSRNDTVMAAIEHIEGAFEVDDETLVVTHDAVRPFVSYRILQENIEAAREFGACDTVVAATDTIVESADGKLITQIPDRRRYYQGQTPQSFNLRKLAALAARLTDEERASLTDACKIFTLRGEPVALVQGDVSNMKVTYPQDMRVAQAMLDAACERGEQC